MSMFDSGLKEFGEAVASFRPEANFSPSEEFARFLAYFSVGDVYMDIFENPRAIVIELSSGEAGVELAYSEIMEVVSPEERLLLFGESLLDECYSFELKDLKAVLSAIFEIPQWNVLRAQRAGTYFAFSFEGEMIYLRDKVGNCC